MIRRPLIIGRWAVDFLFSAGSADVKGVMECLSDAGAPEWALLNADDLMRSCEYDCGFTFTNPEEKRAVVFIGNTSSGAEFTDTLVHEVHHLAVAIAAELGIDLDSETPAYVAGDAARALADVICELGCSRCH